MANNYFCCTSNLILSFSSQRSTKNKKLKLRMQPDFGELMRGVISAN